jgi:hypothetical protein
MLENYRVASRVVLSSIELVSYLGVNILSPILLPVPSALFCQDVIVIFVLPQLERKLAAASV